jgi:predicted nucleic acid-binding protein
MRAVVDTNVIAYYLLGTPAHAAETRQFWEDASEPLAPSLWEAELANVMWMSIRAGVLRDADGPAKLHLARRLGIHSVAARSLWHGALLRSVQSGVAAYDTLFVELAERERLPLVTFDQKLLRTWPTIACRPASFTAASSR